MPCLAIIPARAVADAALTDTQLRVLCAIGTFTNRLGGNVWASIGTLANGCNLSERTVQRAIPVLVDAGYLRVVTRTGRTNLYEVSLESPPTQESSGGDCADGGGVTVQSPKRSIERSTQRTAKANLNALNGLFAEAPFQQAMDTIWKTFPARSEPHNVYVPCRRAVGEAYIGGAPLEALVTAASQYAQHVLRTQTESKYVKGMAAFYRDGLWQQFTIETVHGRTRDEWARSGQDVEEFDRLLQREA